MSLLGLNENTAIERLKDEKVRVERLDNLWAREEEGSWRIISHKVEGDTHVLISTLFKHLKENGEE
ncbi:MAG: hypothetical protein E7334_11065 [Clostridiales bacterium]|nr:hypothetical protein [Clostridiales bacterium]MBQ2817970.1 hypothetical protein [Clostridia bacterium]